MPLFALANAGVELGAVGMDRVVFGVMAGLLLGKPLGIFLFSRLAVRLGYAALPSNVTWRQLHAVAWLAGIGFTMSLFVADLAFGMSELITSAKVGIIGASVLAGVVGWSLLRRA
jgi:NhaA family Na+:H+ antiporter